MRNASLALLFVFECGVAHPLLAQAPPTEQPSTKIETTVDMRENASKELKAADAQLNKVYSQLLSKMQDPDQQSKLKSAQRAWMKYRDSQAEFEASFYKAGSIQPQIFTISLMTTTKKRAQELQMILNSVLSQ